MSASALSVVVTMSSCENTQAVPFVQLPAAKKRHGGFALVETISANPVCVGPCCRECCDVARCRNLHVAPREQDPRSKNVHWLAVPRFTSASAASL